MLGPRRFGATSVLRTARSILTDAGTAAIWIDRYETRSAADLVVRVDNALASTAGGVRDRLDSLAASASVNLGMFKLEFARPVSQRPDADASLHVVLDLLVDAALAAPTVIVIDELTGLGGVSGATELLRTQLQHHVQDVGLLFAGTEPTAMAAVFAGGSQPFSGQADVVEIPPFSTAELRASWSTASQRRTATRGTCLGSSPGSPVGTPTGPCSSPMPPGAPPMPPGASPCPAPSHRSTCGPARSPRSTR